MNLVRRERETQLSFAGRMLIEHGEVSVYDVLYEARYEDGRKTSVTRLAAVIHTLRHDFGWDIETIDRDGAVATYVLRGRPEKSPTAAPRAAASVPPAEPEWQRGWKCIECGGRPAGAPSVLLGGMGQASCLGCRESRYFTRIAA